MRTIPWHRLLSKHHRLLVWWALAGIGIAAPWLIGGGGLSLFLGATVKDGCIVASVYDGDTLRADCGGEKLKVRLYCIDAPEMGQRPWGTESRDHLRDVMSRVVTLRVQDTDRYGRKVAEVINPATGEALNLAMVRAGMAAVYLRFCSDPSYARAEGEARAAGLGIWSREGEQQRPWDWRVR